MTDTPLAGRVAYVTGAARGQGRSHCVRLARAGADVVAIDACGPVAGHNGYEAATPEDLAETVHLVEGEGRKILAREVDVRDAAGQQRVVADAIEQFGRLDIVVANAGVLNWGRLWETSTEQWQETLDTNLTGLWHTVKATDTPMGNDLSMYTTFQDHPHYIHSYSPGALPTDSLAAPDLISDIVVWLAGDASALVTAAQIPADKGYLKI
jgi:enoyl-[acyl-carrier-protein] reductase (NADH)